MTLMDKKYLYFCCTIVATALLILSIVNIIPITFIPFLENRWSTFFLWLVFTSLLLISNTEYKSFTFSDWEKKEYIDHDNLNNTYWDYSSAVHFNLHTSLYFCCYNLYLQICSLQYKCQEIYLYGCIDWMHPKYLYITVPLIFTPK